MKLPNAENAKIKKEKIINYLLSETHPIGKFKAKFFRSLGFNENNADLLSNALLQIALSENVIKISNSKFGVKYIIDGYIKTPRGTSVNIRTVWIIERGDDVPNFVTAYPK